MPWKRLRGGKMKVGDLVRYYNPSHNRQSKGLVGLVVGHDDTVSLSFGDKDTAMLRVLFRGFTLTRWVYTTDCELYSES